MAEIKMNFVEMDHEVRIRLLQELVKDNKTQLQDIIKDTQLQFDKLESKIDMHFHWVLGTILGQIALTITLFGGIILHMEKLI